MAIAQTHHTIDEIERALRKNQGLLHPTAKSLGVTREAVRVRVKKSAHLQAVVAEARDSIVDEAEAALFERIEKRDPWAVQFALRTIGRDRGYADRKEITGPEGGPIEVKPVDYRQAVSALGPVEGFAS